MLTATDLPARAKLAGDQAVLSADQSAGAASAQVSADQAAVDADQAALSAAQDSLSAATLTAPISGTVAQLNLAVGQQVSASGSAGGASSGAGNGAATVPAQMVVVGDGFVVNVSIDDTQIGLIKPGQHANVVPAGAIAPVPGTVTSVGLLAGTTSGVATFPVVVTVTGTPSGLHAGATASVSIVYEQLSTVVVVPTAAVQYGSGQGAGTSTQAVVLQSHGGKRVRVAVTVGPSAGGYTQILSGLSAGDQVLVPQSRTSGGSGGGGGGISKFLRGGSGR